MLPLQPPIHVSVSAHHFQNDGVKKGWEGRGIRDVDQQPILREARWHKQCVERVCIVVVVVDVVVFGWGANERNDGGECHRWPGHSEVLFLFEWLTTMRRTMRRTNCQDSSLMCDLEHHTSNISEQEASDKRLFRWDRAGL